MEQMGPHQLQQVLRLPVQLLRERTGSLGIIAQFCSFQEADYNCFAQDEQE